MGYEFSDITVSTPPGCRTRTGCREIEQTWLDTLGDIVEKETSLDRLIVEASNLFCQANTDSPNVLQPTEVVMLANAFDRLFPSANGRYQLSEAISEELGHWITIRTKDGKRMADKQILPSQIDRRCREGWDIVRSWALELYILRNAYVHGVDTSKKQWVWTSNEHLLMGTYVFPLLLKVIMSKERRYQLSEEDVYKLLAIDDLLDLNQFYDTENHKSPWREKLNEVRWHTHLE